MMKISAFVFAITLAGSSMAQDESPILPDSLRIALNQAETDSARVAIYSAETWKIRLSDPKTAAFYSKKAISIAENANLLMMHVDALTDLGYTYEVMGNAENALKYYYSGYELANEISYVWGAIDGINGSGSAHRMLGNLDQAIEMYEEAVFLCRDDPRPLYSSDTDFKISNHFKPLLLGDAYLNLGAVHLDQIRFETALEFFQKSLNQYPDGNRVKALTLLSIGDVHLKLDNRKKAIEYFEKAKVSAKALDDKIIEASAHGLLGQINRESKDFSGALNEYEAALENFRQLKNLREISKIHHNIGGVYYDMKVYEKAIKFYQLSLQNAQVSDDVSTKSFALLGICNSYIMLEQVNKVESYLRQLSSLLPQINDKILIRDSYLMMSKWHEKSNNFQKAYENYLMYFELNESIFNSEKSKQLTEIETRFNTKEKEKAIDLLNAKNEINTLQLQKREGQRNIFFVVAIAFLVLGLVLYSRYKLKVKANKKLEELDQMKSRFFTDISHEFRTPLTLILGPIENKLSQNPTRENKEQLLLMQRNANRLLELINQLMELSKLEAGELKLHLESANFLTFLKTMTASFESLAFQKRIEFNLEIPDGEMIIPFDYDKCYKIFYNLLSNAIKFSPNGAVISVNIKRLYEKIEISISDSGKGIPSEELENIFKRFHQLNDSTQTRGSGVGLSLVRELVILHKGTIEVESRINEGTTFKVTLPSIESSFSSDEFIKQDQITPLTVQTGDTLLETSQFDKIEGENILIVEDNVDVRNYISSILSPSYNIEMAENGKDGLKLGKESIPDLIISDLMMPEMDGNELCIALKADERTSHIPVIMLTAKADSSSKIEGLKTGADDYLIKPFNEEELKVRVKNLIDQRKKLRERYSEQSSPVFEISPIAITPPDKIFMEKAIKLIEDNISNYDFTVEFFQKEMAMSRMQLHRKLKALTNCSTSEFVRKQRLRRAAQILEVGGISVSEAAYSSGFNNLSYFAKCFKEEFEVSPSEYSDTF